MLWRRGERKPEEVQSGSGTGRSGKFALHPIGLKELLKGFS